jgi:hypothetical protein
LLAARLVRRPSVCHVHEAETQVRPVINRLMMLPLHLATAIIVISRATQAAMISGQPRLAERTRLIYNGVPGPGTPLGPAPSGIPVRLLTIGRLSPRKAPHATLDAAARLRAQGYDVIVELAGSVFGSYEWYEEQLRERAARADLAGRVQFSGYQAPIWRALARAHIVVQPSGQEPFGNAVVEAMLAGRPVVAAAAQGHLESLDHGRTGLLVRADDADALADGIRTLLEEPDLGGRIAGVARDEAERRFSVGRYRQQVSGLVAQLAGRRSPDDEPAPVSA